MCKVINNLLYIKNLLEKKTSFPHLKGLYIVFLKYKTTLIFFLIITIIIFFTLKYHTSNFFNIPYNTSKDKGLPIQRCRCLTS